MLRGILLVMISYALCTFLARNCSGGFAFHFSLPPAPPQSLFRTPNPPFRRLKSAFALPATRPRLSSNVRALICERHSSALALALIRILQYTYIVAEVLQQRASLAKEQGAFSRSTFTFSPVGGNRYERRPLVYYTDAASLTSLTISSSLLSVTPPPPTTPTSS